MAVAMLSKKKLKNRSKQRSLSSRAFEEEEEDMGIISRLESEPWQPDLLLERQFDNKTASSPSFLSTSSTTVAAEGAYNTIASIDYLNRNEGQNSTTTPGSQRVIPVIIKSPSSVITTADDSSDCVESVFEDHTLKRPGIQEYLQQTHQEQQLLQQQQQEMQTQMQSELQLHYQLPAHLQSTLSTHNITRRQQQPPQPHLQQYRNSFHGHSGVSLGLEEDPTGFLSKPLLTSARSEFSLENTCVTDSESVTQSLQSLKNITMLALDNLLQHVVSDVTASDPVHNPDETTLHARAFIRRKSNPLLNLVDQEQDPFGDQQYQQYQQQDQEEDLRPTITNHGSPVQRSISSTPIASMAASSRERLDELTRKVDQLAAVTHAEDHRQLSSERTFEVLHEPLEIPTRQRSHPTTCSSNNNKNNNNSNNNPFSEQPVQQQQRQPRLDPSHIFESQEYQLACALAAMLACIYRILDHMPEQSEQPRRKKTPQRTESVDSGLDQASNLWKRLSSNSFMPRNTTRQPLSSSLGPSNKWNSQGWSSDTTNTASPLFSSDNKALVMGSEDAGGATATTNFMQTINKQVRTLRSRRSQSTSQIEVTGSNGHSSKSLHDRLLGGLGFGSKTRSAPYLENAAQVERARELEREWSELDKLMEEMGHLWRLVETLEDESNEEKERPRAVETTSISERDPFHDSNQIPANAYSVASARYFDQQTLDMTTEAAPGDDLPRYEDSNAPEYELSEKAGHEATQFKDAHSVEDLRRRSSRNGLHGIPGLEDEKTRFDLNNVMSAIERLSKVAPRMDNQRVQLSPSQKRQMAQASVAHTIDRLSRDRWEGSGATTLSSSSSSPSTQKKDTQGQHQQQRQLSMERSRDLNKLVNQIVESANRASFVAQRAEFSPRQQWKLEGARVGDKIERGERLRMSGQDWQSPEKVLLKDMTRLTNTLYQQSASSKSFATQRYTLTDDKARNMALQEIISKIERVSGRRMDNQDALPPSSKPRSVSSSSSSSPAMIESRSSSSSNSCSSGSGSGSRKSNNKAKDLQEMMKQVAESGGGPTRKSAMASQRAQFGPKH
ncbi:hypothetical protein BC939DRAFT_440567 [Gamsiella multidivaricata]|uniref:uncharacterized protein n=1 Tax=Gamsiella multidivaricata TaxID=101098 RepID=UPI0022207AD3|nr:uncharacterized protein BC939DRAFT_440567 [Gamsiella multidivaricata]KAI7829782.1 hypothetical protein BC939DRAFT_440567 [Gamsiella multidivaricata]